MFIDGFQDYRPSLVLLKTIRTIESDNRPHQVMSFGKESVVSVIVT